jgi:hypothetical protein
MAAANLLHRARASGWRVPIVFAPGEDIWELHYYGFIAEIRIVDGEERRETIIEVSGLARFAKPRPIKTELVVRSTGANLPESHIRPYVICKTPGFLYKAVEKAHVAAAKKAPKSARRSGA